MGWLGMGSFVNQFEEAVKQFVQASDRFVAAVSTGHAAIHLGLINAGVGPGDEVITPAFNNIADFQAILATGATPVFCDIEDSSLCIDMNKAEDLVTKKTKAIIVMDYDCILCDHDRIYEFAKIHKLRVIHDAAHSLGSKYRGKMVGSFSDICVFSFDPVKTITCIDGGILVVKSSEELSSIHEMRLIGMCQPSSIMYQNQRAWTYDVKRLGFRYHMSNLHAALGLSQLSKIKTISETRRWACCYYNEQLSQIAELKVPQTDFNSVVPFLYYIRVPEKDRANLRDFLKNKGIDTGIHWQPGHWFSLFKEYPQGDLTVTNQVGKEIISLPLHSCMLKEDLYRVVEAINTFFKHKT